MTTSCKYCTDYICTKESIRINDGAYGTNWVHAECGTYRGRNK